MDLEGHTYVCAYDCFRKSMCSDRSLLSDIYTAVSFLLCCVDSDAASFRIPGRQDRAQREITIHEKLLIDLTDVFKPIESLRRSTRINCALDLGCFWGAFGLRALLGVVREIGRVLGVSVGYTFLLCVHSVGLAGVNIESFLRELEPHPTLRS